MACVLVTVDLDNHQTIFSRMTICQTSIAEGNPFVHFTLAALHEAGDVNSSSDCVSG